MKIDITKLSFLSQLSSEIIILDRDLKVIWLNDSALNKGWVLNPNNKDNFIIDQFSEETNGALVSLLKKTIERNGTKTKRDFELTSAANSTRVIAPTPAAPTVFAIVFRLRIADKGRLIFSLK